MKDIERDMKYRNLIILPLLIGVLAFAPYLMNPKTASQSWDDPPQIFVNDSIYRGTGHTVSAIPDDAAYLGSITEAVPQYEPMAHENFRSNTLPAGTELYSSALDQSVVYAKVETPSGESYSKYEKSEPAGSGHNPRPSAG